MDYSVEEVEAGPDVLRQIEELENLLFDNSWNSRTLEVEMSHGARLFVIKHRADIVAYALCGYAGGMVDILRLGVIPRFEGRGFGTKLVQRAIITAPSAMLCVRKSNKRAFNLYMRLGFKIESELDNDVAGVEGCWILKLSAHPL